MKLFSTVTLIPFFALTCQAAWFKNETQPDDTVTIHSEIPIPTSTIEHVATVTQHVVTTARPTINSYHITEEEDVRELSPSEVLLDRIIVDITIQNGTFVAPQTTNGAIGLTSGLALIVVTTVAPILLSGL